MIVQIEIVVNNYLVEYNWILLMKVFLDKHIRLIQGDGVNMKSIKDILHMLEENEFATDNLVFGSGGTLLLLIF